MSKLIEGVTQFDPGTVTLIIHLILFCTLLVTLPYWFKACPLLILPEILTTQSERDNFEVFGKYSVKSSLSEVRLSHQSLTP